MEDIFYLTSFLMRALFIDLASSEKLFALVTEKQTVGSATVDDHTDETKLMPTIESLLKEAHWKFEDLTHVAAVTGPGGFMSLRVGVALANALSWALKIPVAGVHGSDLWHSRTQKANSYKLIANSYLWLHSTKRTHLFVRGYGEFSKEWPKLTLIPIEDLQAKSYKLKATSYIGELIEEHRNALKDMKPHTNLRPVPEILPEIMENREFKTKPLEPWYGRDG